MKSSLTEQEKRNAVAQERARRALQKRIDAGIAFHKIDACTRKAFLPYDSGIERAHEQGGPTSPFACALCNGRGWLATVDYDCPECCGSGNDAEKLARFAKRLDKEMGILIPEAFGFESDKQ